MKILIAFTFLLPISLFAETNSMLGRTPTGQLMLNTGCSEIGEDLTAIIGWTRRLENRGCNIANVDAAVAQARQRQNEGMCTINVTDCVPRQVRQYQGLSSAQNGPNCWNLALVMAGMVPMLRQSSDTEWAYLINSPLCRPLNEGEAPQSGDLGSVEMPNRSPGDAQIHGFMYVSDRMVFSKNGTNLNAPFALQTRAEMEATYSVGRIPGGECESDCGPQQLSRFLSDDQISEFSGNVPSADVCRYGSFGPQTALGQACSALNQHVQDNAEACASACPAPQVKYFRCQTMQEFTRANRIIQPNLGDTDRMLGRIEACLEQAIFDAGGIDSLNTFVTNNMQILASYLETNTPAAANENERVVLNSLALRLNAIGDVVNPGNRQQSDFSRAFWRAYAQLPRPDRTTLMGQQP